MMERMKRVGNDPPRACTAAAKMDEGLGVEAKKAEEKLTTMWAWFGANPDHPRFAEREEEFLDFLREYEAICDDIELVTGVV